MFTYSNTVLWLLYTLFAVCKQSLQINITILVSELNIWAKIWVFSNREVRKWDHSYNNDEKLGQSYTFLRKRGLIIYLAALKKGAIVPHTRTLSYIGSYPHYRGSSDPLFIKWSNYILFGLSGILAGFSVIWVFPINLGTPKTLAEVNLIWLSLFS